MLDALSLVVLRNVSFIIGVLPAIYLISQATTFWAGVPGFLKALVWPAFLVYEAFNHSLAVKKYFSDAWSGSWYRLIKSVGVSPQNLLKALIKCI